MGSIPFHGFVENSENEGKKMLTELITHRIIAQAMKQTVHGDEKIF